MILNPLLYGQNRWYFLLCLFGLAGIQFYGVVHFMDMAPSPAAVDAVLSWITFGALMFFVANTLSYYHPSRGKFLIVLFVPLLLAYLWLQLDTAMIVWLIDGKDYEFFIADSQLYRFTVAFLILAATILYSLTWYRLGEKEDEQRRQEETERIVKEAELFKLRQQLQPHFLFNSLNSINSLIGNRPNEARTMVQQLSDFLRGTLRREEQKFIPLKEEMEYLRIYLDIEQVRFGHRLEVKMECEEDVMDWKLPPLILQPILENAIKFGLYGTIEKLVINFKCEAFGNQMNINISNPFDEDMTTPEGTGFGLRSVKRRLYLLFARTDLLETAIKDNRFTVNIKIPKLHD